MFEKLELMILGGLVAQVKMLDEDVREYKALITRKGIHFDKKKRLLKRQKVRAEITRLAELVDQYPEILNNSHTEDYYEDFRFNIHAKVELPDKLKDQFSDMDDLSYLCILKIERDHPNDPKYLPLTKHINDNYYFQLYRSMKGIIIITNNTLSIDELKTMRQLNSNHH